MCKNPASTVYVRATSETHRISLFLTMGVNSQKIAFPSHYQLMMYIYELFEFLHPTVFFLTYGKGVFVQPHCSANSVMSIHSYWLTWSTEEAVPLKSIVFTRSTCKHICKSQYNNQTLWTSWKKLFIFLL